MIVFVFVCVRVCLCLCFFVFVFVCVCVCRGSRDFEGKVELFGDLFCNCNVVLPGALVQVGQLVLEPYLQVESPRLEALLLDEFQSH